MTDKNVVTSCPECGYIFLYETHDESLPGGIEHRFALCPNCGLVTTVWVSDKVIRRLMTVQKRTRNTGERERLRRSMLRKMNALKEDLEL